MAAEAAAPAASGGASSGAAGASPGASAGAAPKGGGGGGGSLPGKPPGAPGGSSKGVLLAIGIILLWLAGFCFFIALEGATLLGEQSDTSGGGLLRAMISGLATKAAAQEQQGTSGQGGG